MTGPVAPTREESLMTTKVLNPTTAVDHYRSLFRARATRRVGAEPPWLADLRAAAMARFAATGLPATRDERWHYTSLAAVAPVAFAPPGEQCIGLDTGDLAPLLMAPGAKARLCFVNGRLAPSLCLAPSLSADGIGRGAPSPRGAGVSPTPAGDDPTGVHGRPCGGPAAPPERSALRLAGWAQAIERWPDEMAHHLGHHLGADQPVAELNMALACDGAVLFVADGVDAGRVELLFLTTATSEPLFSAPRNLIVLGAGAHATVVENHVALGTANAFADPVTEIDLGARAQLDYLKLVHEPGSFHTATVAVTQGCDSRLTAHLLALGGRLARTEFATHLAGAGGSAQLFGLALAGGGDHLDLTTRIDHDALATRSRELVKQIVTGRGRGCFSGLVHVHPGAQQTDARLTNANLLLSDRAEADTRPILRIDADDVKCSHGATVGRLDDEALFYLRARGLDADEARQILTAAFATEVVASVADPTVAAAVRARVDRRLTELLEEPR